MYAFLVASSFSSGWTAEDRFWGKVFHEWVWDAQEFFRVKLPHLIVIAAIALLLSWLLRIASHHMVLVAERNASSRGRISQVKTLAGVIHTTGRAIVWIITGLQILSDLGVNLSPLLASAGVMGIAIGLAAQNIFRDLLNGITILIEGQFGVGDVVRLAGVSGTVEFMSLRRTTVREADGTVHMIPNSQITTVANLSMDYSVAIVSVSVDYSADPDLVMRLLEKAALDVRESEEYCDIFLEDPQVLGMESVKGSEILFPVRFKTMVNKQAAPVREFRRLVRLALKEQKLLPGDPYRVFMSFDEAVEEVSKAAMRGPI